MACAGTGPYLLSKGMEGPAWGWVRSRAYQSSRTLALPEAEMSCYPHKLTSCLSTRTSRQARSTAVMTQRCPCQEKSLLLFMVILEGCPQGWRPPIPSHSPEHPDPLFQQYHWPPRFVILTTATVGCKCQPE